MAKVPISEQVQVNFRMPKELKDLIKFSAVENGRSLNAEIVHTLEQYYEDPKLLEVKPYKTSNAARRAARREAARLVKKQQAELEKILIVLDEDDREDKN